MPYQLHWEPHGVYRRYWGDVSARERRSSLIQICSDARFDTLHYAITDFLEVGACPFSAEDTDDTAAMHVGPLMTNPTIVMAAIAVRIDIVQAVQAFRETLMVDAPYGVFPNMAQARAWIATQRRQIWSG